MTVPAVSRQEAQLEDAIAALPHMTVHLVDLPDRLWVVDPAALTCWVHKHAALDQRIEWWKQAAWAIVEQRPDLAPQSGPRLRSVPSRGPSAGQ